MKSEMWNAVLSRLKRMLEGQIFTLWIEPLTVRFESEKSLVLCAPNRFAADVVSKRYLTDICRAAAESAGYPVDIRVDVTKQQSEQTSARIITAERLRQRLPLPLPTGVLLPARDHSGCRQIKNERPRTARISAQAVPTQSVLPNLGLSKIAKPVISSSPVASPAISPVGSLDASASASTALTSALVFMPELVPASAHPLTPVQPSRAVRQPRQGEVKPRPLSVPDAVLAEIPMRLSSRRVVSAEQLTLPIRTAPIAHTWRYDFSSFVVGYGNETAHAAAKSIAYGTTRNDTLFLSAGPGLGKTHLTQAVGAALCGICNHANPRVEYLTAEAFANCFVTASRTKEFDRFRNRFHGSDVLLLEDVHFLSGKERFQTELLSAVKSLQESGKKVVLTSSFSPRELSGVDEALVSRFSSGLLVSIDKPDFNTRRKILLEKAKLLHAGISGDVADLLAEQLTGDIRQLESCLESLLLQSRTESALPTVDMAWEVLSRYAATAPFINIDSITRRVCEAFALTPAQLCTRSRKTSYVQARNTIFYLARKHTDMSLEAIGEHFSRRHSTVLKGIAAVERDMNRETTVGRQLASTIERIESRCGS